jgi:dCTP diphosphatase
MNDSTLAELTQIALTFRDERQWKQFHNPKELAMVLCAESAEVLEEMLFKPVAELERPDAEKKQAIADELSDVLHAVFLLAHDLDIDLAEAFKVKMKKNEQKYPVEKARGRSDKYTTL